MKVWHYSKLTKSAAQELRKNMTPEEKLLWYKFLKSYPQQFRRQKQFGRFIVDFYCSAANLVVELDGDHHFSEQGMAYDEERSLYLNGLGLYVLRFTNADVRDHFEAVCEKIHLHVQAAMQ